MAPSKKKKVVIPKPDMPALVPADCHIGKGDVDIFGQKPGRRTPPPLFRGRRNQKNRSFPAKIPFLLTF